MAEFRLETERLVLRSWRDEDRPAFAAMSADPAVMEHLGGTVPTNESDAIIARLAAVERDQGHTFWAIERRDDGGFLGFCGLRRGGHADTPVPDELEIGWRLARDAWGRGYAREAAEASIRWGWENCEAMRIAAWTVVGNKASWGLMIRLGMVHRPELDFDHPRFAIGHPLCRHLVYTIDRPA
jgi:RimJ/RimL family protein N-acetyltransferase